MNILLHGKNAAEEFATQLHQLGSGFISNDKNFGHAVLSEKDLISNYFLIFLFTHRDMTWLSERAILVSNSFASHMINRIMLDIVPEQNGICELLDKVIDEAQAVNYPAEFLHS